MTDASSYRLQRIKYAAATSVVSKAVTIAVQLIALPVAIRALGQDQFALYAVLAAALGWAGLANIGVGPPLAVSTADAVAQSDLVAERQLFASAFFPVLAVVGVLALGLFALLPIVPIEQFFGQQYVSQAATIRDGIALLLMMTLAQALLSIAEAAQTGHQEQYIFNAWAAVGNFVSLVALLAVARLAPSVIMMIVAVNVPPLAARLVNSGRFLAHRSHLFPRLTHFSWQKARFLLGNGAAFSLAASLGSFLNHQYTVILVGRTSTTQETSTFAVMMNVFILAFGVLSMLALPLWPAIADSQSRGEIRWARTAYRKTLLSGLAYAVTFALGLTLCGQIILRIWFGSTINPSRLLLLMTGLYFVVDTWEYVHYTVLIGLGRIWLPSLVYLIRSLIGVGLAPLLLNRYQDAGAMIALIISVVFTTGPILWMLIRRYLKLQTRCIP